MNELVFVKQDDIFTDSYIISQNVGYAHKDIKSHIEKNKNRFLKLGNNYVHSVSIRHGVGQPIKAYQLNETQAVFLMTLLDNNETVLDFKMKLAIQFTTMRKLLLEKQTAEWQQARIQGKQIRREETDVIQERIDYAKNQGSEHADMLYVSYTKLVKTLAGYDRRDNCTADMLIKIMLFETTLFGIISEEMTAGTEYHEIYKRAKTELTRLKLYWSKPLARLTSQSV